MAEAAFRRRRAFSWRLALAGTWLTIVVFCALFAPLIAPHDPLRQDLLYGRVPPIWMDGGEPGYLLGTDGLGRDVLSRAHLRQPHRADRRLRRGSRSPA